MNNDEYDDDYDHEKEDEYYDDNENQKLQNQHQQQYLQNQQRQSQQQQHRQSSGNGGFQHYQRLRRDVPDLNDLELKNRLSCNRSRCALIRCTTTQLDTDSSAWIALRMRLVTQTLNLVSLTINNY